MNSYVSKVLEELKAKNPNQPEFHQAATEVLDSLSVVFDKHPEYEARGLLNMLVDKTFITTFYDMCPPLSIMEVVR